MDKLKSVTSLLVGTCVLLWAFPFTAQADQYQDQIDRFFPGFQIVAPTEFWRSIRDKNPKRNPGLITGMFNHDDLEDFAVLIRSKKSVWRDKWKYYEYEGRIVVCQGTKGGNYQCMTLSKLGYARRSGAYFKSGFYLKKREPGRVGCWDKDAVVTTDIIENVGDTTASAFFWQPDGTYRRCVTAD